MNLIETARNVLAKLPLPLMLAGPKPKLPNYKVEWAKHPNGQRVLLVYGVRWFPEWEGPRIYVRAYLILTMGDAIGYNEERISTWQSMTNLDASALATGKWPEPYKNAGLLAEMGLSIPDKPEPYEAFSIAHYRSMVR